MKKLRLRMSYVLVWQLLGIAQFCWAVAAQVQSAPSYQVNQAELYGIPAEKKTEWDVLSANAEQDPPAYLEAIQKKLNEITSETAVRFYGELILINLLLKLERAPEAMKRIDKIWTDILLSERPIFRAKIYEEKAKAQNSLSQYREALENIDLAMKEFEAVNSMGDFSRARMIRGLIHVSQEHYNEALNDYLAAYQYFKATNDNSRLAAVVASIAQVYSQTGQHLEAVKYYKESLELIDQDSLKLNASIILFNIGTAYDRAKNWEQSEIYLKKALAISQEINDAVGMAYAWHELGDLQTKRGENLAAMDYFERAHTIILKNKDQRMQINIEITMGETLTRLGRFELAHQYLDNALQLAKRLEIRLGTINAYRAKAKAYEENAEFEAAYRAHKQYVKLLEEDYEERNKQSLNELKVSFDTATKEAQNELLKKENAVNLLAIEKQNAESRMLWALFSLSLLVVLMIVFMLWRQIQVRKRFSVLALTDELTSAPNRRNIVEFAQCQIELVKSTKTPLSIAIIDLDKFKSINDTYGHDVGDKVLQQFYHLGRNALRSGDRLGRFGGEEWLLVMPGFLLEQVNDVFVRLRDMINSKPIPGLPHGSKITFSMGVVAYQAGVSLNALLKQADAALYKAKLQGRNQWQIGKSED